MKSNTGQEGTRISSSKTFICNIKLSLNVGEGEREKREGRHKLMRGNLSKVINPNLGEGQLEQPTDNTGPKTRLASTIDDTK